MTASLRVVIVDDEPAVARLHTRFASAHHACEVVAVATTGPEAIAIVQELEPDLVLLDLHLPGCSGLDVLRTVRAGRGRQPEFIAVTAARDFDSVRLARLAGVRHYLVKPFSAQDLYSRIDDVVHDLTASATAGGALDQDDIDSLIGGAPAQAVLPKGLSTETLSAVRDALDAAEGSSAADIATKVGISRVTSRRYLEHLAQTGLATRRLDYETSGRPRTLYSPR